MPTLADKAATMGIAAGRKGAVARNALRKLQATAGCKASRAESGRLVIRLNASAHSGDVAPKFVVSQQRD